MTVLSLLSSQLRIQFSTAGEALPILMLHLLLSVLTRFLDRSGGCCGEQININKTCCVEHVNTLKHFKPGVVTFG